MSTFQRSFTYRGIVYVNSGVDMIVCVGRVSVILLLVIYIFLISAGQLEHVFPKLLPDMYSCSFLSVLLLCVWSSVSCSPVC